MPITDLAYAVRQLEGEPDVYLTQNRFFGRRRLVSQLAELDALFVDLDYYKTEHADAHPQHVLGLALETLGRQRIPSPSFAVAPAVEGSALIWLHRPVPRAALPRWRACQQVLWPTLQPSGCRPLASDAARVLRLVGTRNSRSDTLVEAIRRPARSGTSAPLADEILPETACRADRVAARARPPAGSREGRLRTTAARSLVRQRRPVGAAPGRAAAAA